MGPSHAQLSRLHGVEGQQPLDDGHAVEEAGHVSSFPVAQDPDA